MLDMVLMTSCTSPRSITSTTVGPSSPIFATTRGGQLVHREHRRLYRDEVARGHETRRPPEVGQLLAEHHVGRELDHRHAGDLRQEWHGPGGTRVDFEHVDVAAVHDVLDVDETAQPEVARDAH